MQNLNIDSHEEENEVKLIDYFHIALRYKWLVIFIFLAVFFAVNIYTARAPKIYKASSRILLEDKQSSAVFFTTISKSASFINNNIEILSSTPLMRIIYQIVQKDNKFKSLPISQIKSDPVPYLKGNISVDSQRDTDILTISFQSTNPEETMIISNAAANGLMQLNTNHARVEFKNTREFLAGQLDEVERRLRGSEEDLRSYKIENGISLLSEETKQLIEQSSDLEAILSEAETELEVADKQLSFLNSELTKQDSILLDVNSILTSPLLDQLRKDVVSNQTRYVNLLTLSGYSPNHPELESLKQEIENAKRKLNEEIVRITSVKVGSSDPLAYRADLIEKIATAQVEQNIANSKVTSLIKAVDDYNKKMLLLPDTEIELARLQRNYTLNDKIYSLLTEKYEDAKIAEKSKIGNVRIVEEAQIPGRPIKPNKKLNMMISIVLGLALGVGMALLMHALDSKIRTFDDVRKFVALPILGTIPFIHVYESDIDHIEKMMTDSEDPDEDKLKIIRQQIESRLITHYAPKSSVSESFRILRTNIVSKRKEKKPMTILITSSGPKEGKSTALSNLAIALAQMDEKVILVDLDLRRPVVHTLFGQDKEMGISDFLVDKSTKIERFIKKSRVPSLDLITSGYIPPNPSELLASHRMDDALENLKDKYDWILLDSPPAIAVTDTMILANKVDILLLVVRVSMADKQVIKRAKELLTNIDVNITGAVINGVQPHKYYSSYEYNYYYYYYYGREEEESKRMPKISRKNKSIS